MYLADEATEPDDQEDFVILKATEHIPFVVYFASVDLVEEGHEHKRVEYDGKVDTRIS